MACTILPDPTDAPVLAADTPSESPAAGQLISALTVRLIYADGYGGCTLASPATTLSPTGSPGAGRITVSLPSPSIPSAVTRVVLYCDSITTVTPGGTFIATDGPTTFWWPFDVLAPGMLPLIELWAHDCAIDILNDLISGVPAANTSSLPRPSGAIPDGPAPPAGVACAGLSALYGAYGVQCLHASVHLGYRTALTQPAGHDPYTQLGPGVELTTGSAQDTYFVPAMSGHPAAASHLRVHVFYYPDGTNNQGAYKYDIPITAGATPDTTFEPHDSALQNSFGIFQDPFYPEGFDYCLVNPPCVARTLAQVQIIRGWGRTGVIHDAGTPASALVTEGGDPLTVGTITP